METCQHSFGFLLKEMLIFPTFCYRNNVQRSMHFRTRFKYDGTRLEVELRLNAGSTGKFPMSLYRRPRRPQLAQMTATLPEVLSAAPLVPVVHTPGPGSGFCLTAPWK